MSDWQVQIGDVLERLRGMPAGSVQCVVTSPPYWGLRDYGVDGMIGLEPTLAEHMAKIVEVFGEVRRVLRDDGTLWLNYGDCYSQGTGKRENNPFNGSQSHIRPQRASGDDLGSLDPGLAAKQRFLLPARVALALQDSGWWVRSEIVWAKGVSFCPTYSGSCMPSSVRDRPTDSHEMLYLLTKAPRYFYDGDAVREAAEYGRRDWSDTAGNLAGVGIDGAKGGGTVSGGDPSAGRNLRTVWTINPKGYKEAHFATYPEALVEPCLKAGTSERGACSECGAPWMRVVERDSPEQRDDRPNRYQVKDGDNSGGPGNLNGPEYAAWLAANPATVHWAPTCDHPDAPVRPCIVLDPFNGSGTTGAVAVRLGRDYVGIELNPEYAALANTRIGRAAAEVGAGGSASMDEDPVAAQLGLWGGA